MNKLQFNRMATTVLFAVLVLVSSVALAQKPIKRPPKKVRQTTTQQVAKPPKKTVAPAKPTKGKINGHEWVDLGLSAKWATKNVGADSLLDYGDYFGWGETSKYEYIPENSKPYGLYKWSDISGNSEYDAARANWGGSWRMPTYAEFKELKEKCSWVWTTIDDINGYTIYGPNGNSIFLPAAGFWAFNEFCKFNNEGFYWSSTLNIDDQYESFALIFLSDEKKFEDCDQYAGATIRPVTK